MSAHRFYFVSSRFLEDEDFDESYKHLIGSKAAAKRFAADNGYNAFEFTVITPKRNEAVGMFTAYIAGPKRAFHVFDQPGSWQVRQIHPLPKEAANG